MYCTINKLSHINKHVLPTFTTTKNNKSTNPNDFTMKINVWLVKLAFICLCCYYCVAFFSFQNLIRSFKSFHAHCGVAFL